MKKFALVLLLSGFYGWLAGAWADSSDRNDQEVVMNTRYSYYTDERQAELLVRFPEGKVTKPLKMTIQLTGNQVVHLDTVLIDRLLRVTVPINDLSLGRHNITALVWTGLDTLQLQAELIRLVPKANGVRIDRLTGHLSIGQEPWFPFGFYCYSPVSPVLAEEEVVRGFNLMSPYQTITAASRKEREVYMDRCARLGMKVHFQLISVGGGGGVGASRLAGLSEEQKLSRLREEIEYFKDHPALLAWYLSDEPTGQGVEPEELRKSYDLIRELDPYHPVTIVFDAPQRAREYAGVMDIVMADPYPIPNSDIDGVGTVTEGLKRVFEFEKPVWIVPQAFGGGEWWGREPSPGEIRAMTYLALVRGATGIQYFIRHGLNGFPKSPATWGECSKMAFEVAEMTNYLLKGEPLKELTSVKDGIWTAGWKLGNEILILMVNSKNEPREYRIELPGAKSKTPVEVIFEHRKTETEGNVIRGWTGAYGTMVFRLGSDDPEVLHDNLFSDPGFENLHSYGVPAACYARVGADRGSTAFLDTRTKVSGKHSLRLTTPKTGQGMGLSFFPVSLNSGQAYRFSIQARADTTSWLPERRAGWLKRIFHKPAKIDRSFKVVVPGIGEQSFIPDSDWKTYTFYFNVPTKSDGQLKVNAYLELSGQGVAWFDEMILTEDPVMKYTFNRPKNCPEIILSTGTPGGVIRYNLAGLVPAPDDPVYVEPLQVKQSVTLAAGLFSGNHLLAWSVGTFKSHLAIGHLPVYDKAFSSQYNAGGPAGLVDGLSGTRNYLDGRWQGFNGQDLRATIDLGSVQTVTSVTVGFLQDISAWIFMPLKLEVEGSADGREFKWLGSVNNAIDERARGSIRKDFSATFGGVPVRYVRIKAVNRKLCPPWHNGKGKSAFVFADEITVE